MITLMEMKNLDLIAKIANWIIIALCLYAVGCCGFHILPVWGYSDHYKDINTTLLSIALSYIAGYMIYFFTSVLPNIQRKKEVFKLWMPHLSKLYNEISERIEEIRAYADIPEGKMSNLKEEDAEPLTKYTVMKSSVYISKTVDRGESQPLKMIDEFCVKKTLNRHYDAVNKIINTMLRNPMAVDADKKLLDVLSQIKTTSFLEECARIIDVTKLDGAQNISTPELSKSYVEYVRLRDMLNGWDFPKYMYSMRMLTDEEVKEMHRGTVEQLARMGTTLQEVQEFGQKLTNASKKI